MKRGTVIIGLLAQLAIAPLAHATDSDTQRITVGVPVYVVHFKDRKGSLDWNEGFANNPGAFVDYSRRVWTVSDDWDFRFGAMAGVMENSKSKTSVFGGGMVEFEHAVSSTVSLQSGAYFGATSGYGDRLKPVLAPYVGASVGIAKKTEVSARFFLLPASAPALVSTVGLAYRF